MSTAFADVAAWPTKNTAPAQAGHNKPPLDETIVAEFVEGLALEGITKRVDDLIAAAKASGPCEDDETAGNFADFAKQVLAATKAVEEHREVHNRPVLNAQCALKGKADGIVAPLIEAANGVRAKLDAYALAQREAAAKKQREADAAAKLAREAAAKALAEAGVDEDVMPVAETFTPPPVAAPKIQGSYGAKVAFTTTYHHEIESVRKLPDRLLKHPKVVEVLNRLVAAEIKASKGKTPIPGVRIWTSDTTAVR